MFRTALKNVAVATVGFITLTTLSLAKAQAEEIPYAPQAYSYPQNTAPVAEAPDTVNNVQAFTAPLSPYGRWVTTPEYGNVWVPNTAVVGADFRPYATGGHWAYTSYGWTWASDYDWGWAPFHYGQWATTSYGWGWIPATTWGPAWVSWRVGAGYIGWSPLAPAGVIIAAPYYGGWSFVGAGGFLAPRPVFIGVGVYGPAFYRTSPMFGTVSYGHVVGYAGPSPAYVSRSVGYSVRPVALRSVGHTAVPGSVGAGYVQRQNTGYRSVVNHQGQFKSVAAPGQANYHAPGQTNYRTASQSQYHPTNQSQYHPTNQSQYHPTNQYQPKSSAPAYSHTRGVSPMPNMYSRGATNSQTTPSYHSAPAPQSSSSSHPTSSGHSGRR